MNFYKIRDWIDQGPSYPFEYNSVMSFCSECGSKDKNIPVMTFLNGDTFGDPIRMTTTDAEQIHHHFCRERENFIPKKTKHCITEDKLVPGFYRDVYEDRICDGVPDCPEVRFKYSSELVPDFTISSEFLIDLEY